MKPEHILPKPGEKKDVLESVKEKEEKEAQQELAARLGLPFINLSLVPIDRTTLTLIPKAESKKIGVAAFSKKGKEINIGIVSPRDTQTQTFLKSLQEQGFTYKLFVVTRTALDNVLRNYPETKQRAPSIQGSMLVDHELLMGLMKKVRTLEALKETIGKHATETT